MSYPHICRTELFRKFPSMSMVSIKGKLDCKKASWEITDIKGVPMVFCEKGNNTICFSSASPFYPEIDVVQLAKDSRQLKKTNRAFFYYIAK